MPKREEINYVAAMKSVLSLDDDEVWRSLADKPWNLAHAARYFLDFAQILQLLPPRPARILDLGVGPGWTSIFLGRCGYTVLGLDIAPDMIRIAQAGTPAGIDVEFRCHDYERRIEERDFDAALVYDALHHAEDEAAVIESAFNALKPGGVLITVEPGVGHSKTADTLSVVERFGTTEKDMEFARQLPSMKRAGFSEIRQYLRLCQLPLAPVNGDLGVGQFARYVRLAGHTWKGGSSIVVAIK